MERELDEELWAETKSEERDILEHVDPTVPIVIVERDPDDHIGIPVTILFFMGISILGIIHCIISYNVYGDTTFGLTTVSLVCSVIIGSIACLCMFLWLRDRNWKTRLPRRIRIFKR